MDTVKYVSKEFLKYIKNNYGITETDTIPAMIVKKEFSSSYAFKDSEGNNIDGTVDVPKDIIVFSEKNGYITNTRSKTKKYVLKMRTASGQIYNSDTNPEIEGSEYFNSQKEAEIKFDSRDDLFDKIAFSKPDDNIISSDEIISKKWFEFDKNDIKKMSFDYFNNLMKEKKEIGEWVYLYCISIAGLLPEGTVDNKAKIIVLNNKNKSDEYRFIVNDSAKGIIDNYRFACFKKTINIDKNEYHKNSLVAVSKATYKELENIIGKEINSYLFMYLKKSKEGEKFGNTMKKYGYDIEESGVNFSKKTKFFSGCFRATYIKKINGNVNENIYTHPEEIPTYNEVEYEKLVQDLLSKFDKKTTDNSSRIIKGNLIRENEGDKTGEVADSNSTSNKVKTADIIKEMVDFAYGSIKTYIIKNEDAMSKKYAEAASQNYSLGGGDNKNVYKNVVNKKWFIFYNEEQAKKFNTEMKGKLIVQLNETFESKEFQEIVKKLKSLNESVIVEKKPKNSNNSKNNNPTTTTATKTQPTTVTTNGDNIDGIIESSKILIKELFVDKFDIGQLSMEEMTVPENIVAKNESIENIKSDLYSIIKEVDLPISTIHNNRSNSIKSDLYRIIKEAEDGEGENQTNAQSIDKNSAVFIPDVNLQYKAQGNYFSITSNNVFVENCYLKTGKLGDAAKFILDVWSPLSVKIEDIGSWLDKGLVDMGSSWVTMLGKGMKSIGNIAKTGKEIGKGTHDFVKNRHKDYKSFSDYIKS